MQDIELAALSDERDGGYRPIDDYAFVGDCHGSALVSRDGSIDWCCLGRFDAPPVFSRILDAGHGGFFQIRPAESARVRRTYRRETNIVETTFTTESGVVTLVDFMPVQRTDGAAERDYTSLTSPGILMRLVEGISGTVEMVAQFRPRPGFTEKPAPLRVSGAAVLADDCPPLSSDARFAVENDVAIARFTLSSWDTKRFVVGGGAGRGAALVEELDTLLNATDCFWRDWSGCVSYHGRYRRAVLRSSLVLKALTYAPTGSIVAAATTSLPEEIGGIRNWDYRYCWLRDACFALYALKKLGLVDEARCFVEFLQMISEKTCPRLLPLYGIGGETELPEREIEHFEGYRRSAPVRSGNEAVEQHQLDVYGQLLDLMYCYDRFGGDLGERGRELAVSFADFVAENWQEPDAGLWEPRLDPVRHTHSAIMSWTALDRAVRLFGEREHWCTARDAVARAVLEEGTHPQEGYLVQAFSRHTPDAAVLIAPMVDFPMDDALLERTVDAVIEKLGHGPLVYRYHADDGLPGEEGTFLVCAFWVVDALLALGRADEARERFEGLLAKANDVGLFSEEMGEDGTFLGNYPQAFTHLGLLQSALMLDLYDQGGVEAVRGTYADRALRDTEARQLRPMTGGSLGEG